MHAHYEEGTDNSMEVYCHKHRGILSVTSLETLDTGGVGVQSGIRAAEKGGAGKNHNIVSSKGVFMNMHNRLLTLLFITVLTLAVPRFIAAQGQGQIVVPKSSVEHPEDVGIRSHTNYLILVRHPERGNRGHGGNVIDSVETPGSLACIYGLVGNTPGCPNAGFSSPPSGSAGSTTLPPGGSGTIAIVDAYDYPTALNDLDEFSHNFGLPRPCQAEGSPSPCFNFTVVYDTPDNQAPSANCGWAQEAALDIEWAHAMAPHANIVLVEANSNNNSDLFDAVTVAANEVVCGQKTCPAGGTGKGEVSMSWGSSENTTESTYDGDMSTSDVTYIAASGDSGGKTIYPSASPNVVSAGGTSIVRDAATGDFVTEQGWSGSGGGTSRYESRPPFQDVISGIVGNRRGTPDFSFDSDPYSGVWVYDTTSCQGLSGWMVFGGTSVATQALAGIVNLAGGFNGGSEQSFLYTTYGNWTNYNDDFHDITSGKAAKYNCVTGWDFVTGIGTDLGLNGK